MITLNLSWCRCRTVSGGHTPYITEKYFSNNSNNQIIIIIIFIGMCLVFFYVCYLKNTDKCIRNISFSTNSKLVPIECEALP